ncbi:Protein of unknown function [Cotesia congregata]|uniref:Uncharacterized protein n=1 Tax=Cotesia congregata TaxID=51543 RepID=A0A8J2HLR5_COTCN|nr:Protein of unknown function [Cotesia congregata]
MNILVKFHDWIDNIQKKLNLTKKTLNDLKWILATKDIEIKVKSHEVKELRHSITEYEKKHKIREEAMKHTEETSNSLNIASISPLNPDSLEPGSEYFIAPLCPNVSTTGVTHVTTISLSSSLKISSDNVLRPEFVTAEHSVVFSVAKATNAFPIGSKNSEHEVEAIELPMVSEKDNVNPEKVSVTQPRKLGSIISQRKVPVALANMSASQTIVSNVSSESVDRQTVLLDMSSMEVGTEEAKRTQPTYRHEISDRIFDVEEETPISRSLPRILEQQSSLTLIDSDSDEDKDKDNLGIKSPEAVRALDQSANLPDVSALRMSILRASVNSGNQTSNQSIRNSGTSVIYEQRLSSQTNLQIPVKEKPVIINITQPKSFNSFDLFRQSGDYDKERKEDERDKREAELKEQISEISRENDKLRRDKLKYESAVKKALFRGFMSLITEEKMKVPKRRITKICYTPCAPCSTIASSTSK